MIDLNADLGEAVTPHGRAIEDVVAGCVTSVNIACGGHAGDAESIRHAVLTAALHGLSVGAHPSFPDRANFGRASMDIESSVLHLALAEQIARIAAIAESEGVRITHCKPHGALYHEASKNDEVAHVIYLVCADHDPSIRLVGQADSAAVRLWRGCGASVWEEAFADRTYEPDGSLRPRSRQGSLITDPERAAEQAVRLAKTRTVLSSNGTALPLVADTICVHSDTPNAGAIAERVASSLRAAGVVLGGR